MLIETQNSTRNAKKQSGRVLSVRKHLYSYSVLFKSILPFSKCWFKDDEYSKYK